MENKKITREKLSNALNMMKTEYIQNKTLIDSIDESINKVDVALKNSYAKKDLYEGKLHSIRILDRFFYVQIVAFVLSAIAGMLGASIFLPLIIGGITIYETISYSKRAKVKEGIRAEIEKLNNTIDTKQQEKEQLDSLCAKFMEKDLLLSRKIDCLTDYVFDHEHSDVFDVNEICEKVNSIEEEFEGKTK